MKLTALWAPEQQFQHKDGSVLVAGKIYVYNLDRTQLVTTYANGSGTVVNPNPIILDGNGRALCFANEEYKYTAVVCDYYGKELFSFEPVGLGGSGSDAQVSTEITSETLNVEKTFDPHTNTNTFDIELKDKDIDHWIGQHGAPIQISGDSQEAALPLPDTNHRDYVGSFIDRIEDGKYMYLKPGLYQVDCLIGFTQSAEDLQNDLGQILVYTGNGSADESEAWQLDGAGPYANDNRHNLHASFVRKVLDEGQTSNIDCSNLLYFAPGTPFTWSEAFIQRLSIVRLDSISTGSGEGGTGIERVIHDDTLSGDGTGESPLSCSGALEGKQDKLIPGDGISIINNVISCSAQGGGGATYTAGQYIDITPENVINVSGLQPAGNYLTPEDLNGYATTEDIERATSGKLDASAYTAPVQSDWNQTNSSALDYIKNKPTIPSLDGYATQQYVIEQTSGKLDASDYTAPVNADWNSEGGLSEILNKPDVAGLIPGQGITFTPSGDNYVISSTASGDVSKQYVDQAILSATSGKLDAADYTAPEQSDWNEADAADLAYIKNKPVEIGFIAGDGIRFEDLSSAIKISCSAQGGSTYTPGTGIDITNDVISVTSAVAMKSDIPAAQVQSDWTEADTEDPAFIKNKPTEYELVAGTGVTITPSGTNYIISSTGGGGGGSTYTAGDGIDITGDVISVTSAVAKKSDLTTLATKSEVQEVAYQNKILTYGSSVTMSQLYEYLNLNPYLGQNLMVKITSSDLPTAIVNKLGGQSQPVFAHYTHATKVESSGGQVVCFEAPITVTNYTGSTQYPQSYIVQIMATEGSSYSGPVTWSVSYKELKADSDVFWVTLTYSSNTWTGDKTVGELQQAKDDGKLILLKYNEPGYYPSGSTPGFGSYGRVYMPSKWSGSTVYDRDSVFCSVYIDYNYYESTTYKPKMHILQANGNSSGNATFRDVLGSPMELAKASDLPDLSTYATQTYVASQVSGKQDKLTFTYDANDDIIGINGSGIGGTGGGGSSYTAGTGIDITNDVISIDPSVVPSKTDLDGYIPYNAAGVKLPNSHFEIDTSGQAYKLGFDTKTDITSNDFYIGSNSIDLPYRGLGAGTYEFHISSEPAASYIKCAGPGDPIPGLTDGIPVINGVATWILTENIPAGNRQYIGIYDSSDQLVSNAYSSTVWRVTPGTKSEYALKSDLPDTSTYATKSELSTGLGTKQNTLTDITDVQLVNALPASPVAGVLYLIPEA